MYAAKKGGRKIAFRLEARRTDEPIGRRDTPGTEREMRLQFQTVDVFTGTQFVGNPLAVVLNAEGLSTGQMQAIAAEFNLAEHPPSCCRPGTPRIPPKSGYSPRATKCRSPAIPTSVPRSVLARAGSSYGRPVSGDRVIFEEKADSSRSRFCGTARWWWVRNSLPRRRSRSARKLRANWWHRRAESRWPISRPSTIARASHPAAPPSFSPN